MPEEEKTELEMEIPADVTIESMKKLLADLRRTKGITVRTISAAEELLRVLEEDSK